MRSFVREHVYAWCICCCVIEVESDWSFSVASPIGGYHKKKCDVHANFSSVSVNCMVPISALSLSGGHNQQLVSPPPQVTPTNDWLCKLPISLEDDQPDLWGKDWPDVWADSAFKENWRWLFAWPCYDLSQRRVGVPVNRTYSFPKHSGVICHLTCPNMEIGGTCLLHSPSSDLSRITILLAIYI